MMIALTTILIGGLAFTWWIIHHIRSTYVDCPNGEV